MTYIQTEVPDEEYERLRQIAEQRDLSIREALREATATWIDQQETVDETDELFRSVEKTRERAAGRNQTTLRDETDLVEEWEGDAESVTLLDPDK
ncbi:uncharacterized protein Nmag_0116 [Natrialba magadii ATCC 43099]|uniref:Uncharacterized protein n=1 Tax=Natrialba magadii (strain ATCC 43099 / DSM 3394 / CCM 3739 / CIP 104546 / IAM 13178 / JCM 8861 / NBRC 102185 / NCIMB 2190 / MS3) TaxID=547559 RepID=D3SWC2_NATMM|nr:ribbon-helix-helix protein, CopG family [Natrialba magadii]ADD03714.1 uncharacterized protein Nmag_0116 [Natrialba magadii ATCC 43099]ELY33770.1 hypothetical protein C500_01053 [Natrialba magadii ATCC 43099]